MLVRFFFVIFPNSKHISHSNWLHHYSIFMLLVFPSRSLALKSFKIIHGTPLLRLQGSNVPQYPGVGTIFRGCKFPGNWFDQLSREIISKFSSIFIVVFQYYNEVTIVVKGSVHWVTRFIFLPSWLWLYLVVILTVFPWSVLSPCSNL